MHSTLSPPFLPMSRFIRRLQMESREQEMQETIVASERERVLREKQLEQEERLAKVCMCDVHTAECL